MQYSLSVGTIFTYIIFIYLPSGLKVDVFFLLQQLTAGVNGAALPKKKKGKSVVVLKPCDVVEKNGKVFMPNTIEMAKIKKTDRGQFKTNLQFSSKMKESDIKRILVETFPFLECQR